METIETMSNSKGYGVESESVSEWLRSFISMLEGEGAEYAVLRFDMTLLAPDSELDVLVHPSSLNVVLEAIRHVCVQYSHLKVAYWRVMPRHGATIILVWLDSNQEWRHYFLDIRCGIRKKGFVLLHGSSLPGLTAWDEELGVRRLRDDYERALLLIRNELDQRELNPRHVAILNRLTGGDTAYVMGVLGWHLADSGHPQIVHTIRGRLRRTIPHTRYATGALYGRIRQKTLGMNVIIYGPDGVGKSTQAQLIAEFFKTIRIRRVHLYHHLVEVSALNSSSRSGRQATKARVYGRASRRSTLRAIVSLSYLKKLAIVVSRLRPMMRKGHVFVHDRYLLDVFQKFHKTHRVRLSGLERFLSPLTPTEPLVLVLQALPESVAGRTGELTTEEVSAAYNLLFDCLEFGGTRFPGWSLIDANLSIAATHSCIVQHVVNVQTRRVLGLPVDTSG